MAERRRLTLWFSEGEMADLDRFAAEHGVTTGAAARLAVIRAFHGVCRDASAGRVKLRARSAPAPVLGRTHVEPPAIAPAAPPSSPGILERVATMRAHPGGGFPTKEEVGRMMAEDFIGGTSRAERARRPR
jgi:hypothetical protein